MGDLVLSAVLEEVDDVRSVVDRFQLGWLLLVNSE